MRETKLILVEGIPGSGKSTTAQFLTHTLVNQGYPVRWWYEEEIEHPVYLFRDWAGLDRVRDNLTSGRYRAVITAALRQWRRFAALVRAREEIVVIDGCFFGYLTWSLFPLDVPIAEIMAYLLQVERIIAPLNPTLIYFRQEDVARSLARICVRRGGDTEARFIGNVTGTPYGQSRNLQGFAGLVSFWSDYRQLTDMVCAAAPFPTLTIETSAGQWAAYQRQCLCFLNLPANIPAPAAITDPQRYAGTYRTVTNTVAGSATISADGGTLLLDGLTQIWPRTPLLPRDVNTFALESLPFTVAFGEERDGAFGTLHLSGPTLLGGSLPTNFTREVPDCVTYMQDT